MRNRRLILWLGCCLLASPGRSPGQMATARTFILHDNAVTTNAETSAAHSQEAATLPTGTHLLLRLIIPLHTTSATAGAGIYLETISPVIADGRVVIPEHTRVFGTVEHERRPGRMRGRACMRLRFTTMILPDNRVLSFSGSLQSLPGSSTHRTTDERGTFEPVDQIDADVYLVAKATGTGILIGSISHIGIGVGPGALLGAGLAITKVLLTRGDEISLPVGTTVEILLQQPLAVAPQT